MRSPGAARSHGGPLPYLKDQDQHGPSWSPQYLSKFCGLLFMVVAQAVRSAQLPVSRASADGQIDRRPIMASYAGNTEENRKQIISLCNSNATSEHQQIVDRSSADHPVSRSSADHPVSRSSRCESITYQSGRFIGYAFPLPISSRFSFAIFCCLVMTSWFSPRQDRMIFAVHIIM